MNNLTDTKTAANRIGIDERHVRRLLEAGQLKGEKIGSRWLVLLDSLADYEKHPTKGRPKVVREKALKKVAKSRKRNGKTP